MRRESVELNRECSEIDPHIYGHWSLTEVSRFSAGKDSLKGAGSTWKYIHIKKRTWPLLYTIHKSWPEMHHK